MQARTDQVSPMDRLLGESSITIAERPVKSPYSRAFFDRFRCGEALFGFFESNKMDFVSDVLKAG
jgi:hypothetical protein